MKGKDKKTHSRMSRYIKFVFKLYLMIFCVVLTDNLLLVTRYILDVDFPYFDETAEFNYKEYSLRVKTYRAIFCFYYLNQIEFTEDSTLKQYNGLYIGDALNGNYARFTKLIQNLLSRHLLLLSQETEKDECAADFYQGLKDKLEDDYISMRLYN